MFANETVNFVISNIITDLNVTPQTLSSLHIQWNFIPGYADGYYSVEMQKQTANPGIPSFTIQPTTINLGQNVQISYQTEVAAYITLEYGRRDGSLVKLVSPTDITYNETDFSPSTAPDKEATIFTLSVFRGLGQPVAHRQPFPITVNQPPAVIDSFTASSMLVNINGDNKVTLSWQVKNAKTVLIPGFPPPYQDNSLVVTVNNTMTYTLQVTPWGSDGQVVQATVTVYAYKSFPSISVGPMGDGKAFQALPLSITNRARGVIYVSNSAAGHVYQVNQANHQVLPTQFSGIIMALSADEQKLFVAEWNGSPTNMIRMYDTTNPAAVSSLQQPGPPPYSLAINPVGTQLYYLWRNLLTTVSAFSVNEAANTFAYVKDIGIGTSPQAYAFDATGVNLYIGNYKSGSVSVIRLSDNTVTATISLDAGSEPCAFALVGAILFVAGSGGNQVYVIDTTKNTTLPPITAGYQPFALALDQNKKRLFVANFQDNTVTIIDTTTQAVTANLSVGKGPSAIKITDSGNLLFVSNYCDKSLTVVDISGGATVIGTIALEATNGNPVDVSTFPTINNYTDVFVAKEYFNGRNNACSTSSPTDTNLNMSILSIQEKAPSLKLDADKPAGKVSRKRGKRTA
jgi:YVTN family beta-propeller protein